MQGIAGMDFAASLSTGENKLMKLTPPQKRKIKNTLPKGAKVLKIYPSPVADPNKLYYERAAVEYSFNGKEYRAHISMQLSGKE